MMDENENRNGTCGSNHGSEGLKPRRHPLFGALKGTFTIDPDWDLTEPAMPEWAELIDEKYGSKYRKRNANAHRSLSSFDRLRMRRIKNVPRPEPIEG